MFCVGETKSPAKKKKNIRDIYIGDDERKKCN